MLRLVVVRARPLQQPISLCPPGLIWLFEVLSSADDSSFHLRSRLCFRLHGRQSAHYFCPGWDASPKSVGMIFFRAVAKLGSWLLVSPLDDGQEMFDCAAAVVVQAYVEPLCRTIRGSESHVLLAIFSFGQGLRPPGRLSPRPPTKSQGHGRWIILHSNRRCGWRSHYYR